MNTAEGSDDTNAQGQELARVLLVRAVDSAVRDAGRGRINTIGVRALAEGAVVLGHDDLAERVCALLRATPDGAFFQGVITNVELPAHPPESLRQTSPRSQIEREYPPYPGTEGDRREMLTKLAGSSRHVRLCLDGLFDEAWAAAGSDLVREEIGLSAVVLGEFEFGRRVMADPILPEFRRSGMRIVWLIELFRAGRTGEASAVLAELEATGSDIWSRLHLALGLAGRIPWGGYPYPDW